MEPVLKQSTSASKLVGIDVSQLDKVNAIPNKNSDNVLMDGLSQADQMYLNALMDEDSNDSADDETHTVSRAMGTNGSAWSPMVPKPVMMNKRKRPRKMRSSYAVTLSLEDISYIRPSWGLSKGIKRIEVSKSKKNAQPESPSASVDEKEEKTKSGDPKAKQTSPTYYFFLICLAVIVTVLIASSKSIEYYRSEKRILRDKIQMDAKGRKLKIYKPSNEAARHSRSSLEPLLAVNFGQGVPIDLKYKECSCEDYDETTRNYMEPSGDTRTRSDPGECFVCLDWAERANLQIHKTPSGREENSFCYNIKWQSYDTLATPLIDCFEFDHEQWFGLGDVQSPISWPLNKLQFQASKLVTNLTGEFGIINSRSQARAASSGDSVAPQPVQQNTNKTSLQFGSLVEFSLINTAGIHLSNLRTDFQASLRMSSNQKNGANQLCLSTQCADKCGSTWSRADKVEQFKYENNVLQYSICTDTNWRNLVARSFEQRSAKGRPDGTWAKLTLEREDNRKLLNELVDGASAGESKSAAAASTTSPATRSKSEKVGLIERTIFTTSLEFMQTLDGQTMRELVERIVKLNLKTSPMLIIDTRWQTYIGSFKLNAALFPKAKLLFEILHNKGFKIVLTIKPYIDTAIGINNINQLLELNRLVTTSEYNPTPVFYGSSVVSQAEKNIDFEGAAAETAGDPEELVDLKRYFLMRRKSFFSFRNETILVEQRPRGATSMAEKLPLSFKCRESREGYCVLVDLTQERNRVWLIDAIKRSSFLSQEADAILVGGAHPNGFLWDDDYRLGLSKLTDTLFNHEDLFAIPQWTGNFKYIQLAPRQRTWNGLKSIINSVLNLGLTGWSVVHPGSVWGDLKRQDVGAGNQLAFNSSQGGMSSTADEQSDEEELVIRWLQVAVFLPIFQMNDLEPIEKYGLSEQLQNLVRMRKVQIVPELKRNLPPTQLIATSNVNTRPTSGVATDPLYDNTKQMPMIRPVCSGQDAGEIIIGEQFQIGQEIIVAPVLNPGQRQKDIYLPPGFWNDELRKTNIRGGKWLRNYPIELNEIAWFTRVHR